MNSRKNQPASNNASDSTKQTIPIKVKKSLRAHRLTTEDIKKRPSLESRFLRRPSKKKMLWIILIFILVWLIIFGWYNLRLNSFEKANPFWRLVPQNISFFGWFKKTDFLENGSGFLSSLPVQTGLPEKINKAEILFNQAGLDFKKDIIEPLEEKVGFGGWLSSPASPKWFIILQEKAKQSEQFNLSLSKIEQKLKQSFYLSNFSYRQTKITSLRTPDESNPQYHYAQFKNYFLLTNDLNKIQKIIDLIIVW